MNYEYQNSIHIVYAWCYNRHEVKKMKLMEHNQGLILEIWVKLKANHLNYWAYTSSKFMSSDECLRVCD